MLLTLSENLMSPVGLALDEETSACLCIEIRKASTPDTSTLFPTKYQTQFSRYFQLHFCLTVRRKANYKTQTELLERLRVTLRQTANIRFKLRIS